jgi:hypothetical protein
VSTPKATQHDGSPSSTSSQGTGHTPKAPPDSHASVSTHWREAISIVVELTGIGALSAGLWLIRPWAGLIALGVALIVLGIASSPKFDKPTLPE